MAYRSGPHDALPNIRIEREPASRRLRVSLNGATQYPDFAAALAAAGAALREGPSYAVVVDLRGSAYAPSQREAQLLAEQLTELRQKFRGAIALLAGSALQFGVCRMIASLAEASGVPVGAFRTDEEAEPWLLGELRRLPPDGSPSAEP